MCDDMQSPRKSIACFLFGLEHLACQSLNSTKAADAICCSGCLCVDVHSLQTIFLCGYSCVNLHSFQAICFFWYFGVNNLSRIVADRRDSSTRTRSSIQNKKFCSYSQVMRVLDQRSYLEAKNPEFACQSDINLLSI